VRWPPACEDVSQEAEERQLLEDVTRQSSEDLLSWAQSIKLDYFTRRRRQEPVSETFFFNKKRTVFCIKTDRCVKFRNVILLLNLEIDLNTIFNKSCWDLYNTHIMSSKYLRVCCLMSCITSKAFFFVITSSILGVESNWVHSALRPPICLLCQPRVIMMMENLLE
jgi:hypothetical protein